MVDRLAELKRVPGTERTNPLASSGDVEMGAASKLKRPSQDNAPDSPGGGGEPGKFMEDFFKAVDSVKADIKQIKAASKKISEINQSMMLATTSDAEAKLSAELNPIVNRTNGVAKRAKASLTEMAEATSALKTEVEKSKSRGGKVNELRIRENLQSTLCRKFAETVKGYQAAQQSYKDDVKKKVTRQVRIVKEDATDEEIEEVMNSAGGTGEMFKTAILKQAADPVREAYEQAQDKFQDVLRLEQSILELHQMFVDFALLTEQQGELLDQIEYQVTSASDYIKDGNADIEVAIDYQKAARKKQCCLIITLLIIAIVIMAATGMFGNMGGRRRLTQELEVVWPVVTEELLAAGAAAAAAAAAGARVSTPYSHQQPQQQEQQQQQLLLRGVRGVGAALPSHTAMLPSATVLPSMAGKALFSGGRLRGMARKPGAKQDAATTEEAAKEAGYGAVWGGATGEAAGKGAIGGGGGATSQKRPEAMEEAETEEVGGEEAGASRGKAAAAAAAAAAVGGGGGKQPPRSLHALHPLLAIDASKFRVAGVQFDPLVLMTDTKKEGAAVAAASAAGGEARKGMPRGQ